MEFKSQIFKAPSLTKTPKLKKTTFASSTFSGISKSTSIPKVNYGGFAKLLKSKSSGIDLEKISTPTNDNITSTLIETNRILVEIQKQLSYDFAMRIAEEKEKKQIFQKEKSRKKLKAEESQLEKVGKKIGGAVAKTAGKILAPVKNIFDKIIDFVITLGAGIAVNAVFEWLKDPKNIEKVKGWFSWIKDNWKWMAVAVGAIALLPVITTISGILAPLGTIVGLLLSGIPVLLTVLANPVTLGILGVAAGTMALMEGSKFLLDKHQKSKYGEGNAKKGIFATKLGDQYGRISTKKDFNEMTDSEKIEARIIASYDQMLQERQKTNNQIYIAKTSTGFGEAYKENKRKRISELEEKLKAQDRSISQIESGKGGALIQGKTLSELFNIYSASGALPSTSLSKKIYGRQMGGPVTANTPYIVGESGREIFVPNIDGTVINNMKTEKIYQMISSDTRRKISYVELPPITQQMPPPEIPIPASESTVVPFISSVNKADYFIEESPKLYGIMV